MNHSGSVLLIFGLIAIFAGLAFGFKYKKINSSIVRKILGVILAAVTLVRYMYETEANRGTIATDGNYHFLQGLNMFSPFGDDVLSTVISLLLTWFSFTAILAIVLDQFFEYKTFWKIHFIDTQTLRNQIIMAKDTFLL